MCSSDLLSEPLFILICKMGIITKPSLSMAAVRSNEVMGEQRNSFQNLISCRAPIFILAYQRSLVIGHTNQSPVQRMHRPDQSSVSGDILTNERAVEEEGDAQQHAHAERQDEGSSPPPAERAAIASRANQRREYQTQDGTQEPRQAVVLLWKTCTHTHTHTHVQRDTIIREG